MKITLVQPPLLGEEHRLHLTPPLGLVSLGAVLREESADVEVLDLNFLGFQDREPLPPKCVIRGTRRGCAASRVGAQRVSTSSSIGT